MAVTGARIVALVIACAGVAASSASQSPAAPDFEALPYAPKRTVVYRAPAPPAIDGRLDDPAWQAAAWSDPFVDIEGDRKPAPRWLTRVKMLWDADHFYVAADMEEPDLWGTLTTRDAVIFQDPDFEVFIDPDGDTHQYDELEVNVLGTAWDLLLVRPYRDGGPPIDGWDIAGLGIGVNARGTINRPGDKDDGWSIEIAMPWRALREAAPGRRPPAAGDQWRVNFSRVEWLVDVADGRYRKRVNPATGKPFAEDNWVWSPQGAINMHMPERWGVVQFSDQAPGGPEERVRDDPDDLMKWALRRLYYRQQRYRTAHGKYATRLEDLDAANLRVDGQPLSPQIETTASSYEISVASRAGGRVRLRQDGRVWVDRR